MALIDKQPEDIQALFNGIAPDYDRNNAIISLGLHTLVKRQVVKSLNAGEHEKILDACCGTGDITWLIKEIYPKVDVIGADFSAEMLKIAKSRIKNTEFVNADMTNLPFEDGTFDKVVMSFGLRNIKDYKKALTECKRVLKVRGEFIHLDFGKKTFPSKIFDIITTIACNIFFDDTQKYQYLLKSKQQFPKPEKLIEELDQSGFKLKQRKDFLLGVISMQIFRIEK